MSVRAAFPGWLALPLCALSLMAMSLGCADVDGEAVESGGAALERPEGAPRDVRAYIGRAHDPRAQATAAEIAQSKIERAHDACGPCRTRACRMLCILGEDYERAPQRPQSDDDDCLMCGRETGFLPRPLLRHEVIDVDTIVFRWDPVEGAERYVLTGVRWQNPETMTSAESWEWRTNEHTQTVTLEPGNGYTFSLTAWSADDEQRSLPSVPVDLDL